MRCELVILMLAFAGGCAANHPPVEKETRPASAALAFDPPLILAEAPLDLSRENRGEAALAGFEDTSTSYFSIRTDNRETTDDTDRFERRAFIEKVGSVRR